MKLGIKGIAYHFSGMDSIRHLPEFAENNDLLQGFLDGGHRNYVFSNESLSEQAILASQKTLRDSSIAVDDLDAVVIGTSSLRFWPKYSELLSTEILNGLGIMDVPVFGTTLGGCTNYVQSIRMAEAFIRHNGWNNVLVIETNKVAQNGQRHYMPFVSIFGDGCVSAVVTSDRPEYILKGISQVTKPVVPVEGGSQEMLMNNVNGYRSVIADILKRCSLEKDDVDVVIPNNKNIKEIEKLAKIWGVNKEKVYIDNVARIGHVWSGDNLINLADYYSAGETEESHYLMLSQADSTYSAIMLMKQQ